MKASEFLETRELTTVETINGILVNLLIGDQVYGVEADLSSLTERTQVERTDGFTVEGNTLTVGKKQFDLSQIEVIGHQEGIVLPGKK